MNVHICCFNNEFITYVVIWCKEKSKCIYFRLRSYLSKRTVYVWRIIECLTTVVTSFKKLYLTFICLFSKIHRFVRGSSSYFLYIYLCRKDLLWNQNNFWNNDLVFGMSLTCDIFPAFFHYIHILKYVLPFCVFITGKTENYFQNV